MATSPASQSPRDALPLLISSGRAIFFGLVWAALMLLVLFFWLRVKHGDSAVILMYMTLAATLGAAGLAAWQAYALWGKRRTPEGKVEGLARQRHSLAYVLIVSGLVLAGASAYLVFAQNPDRSFFLVTDRLAEACGAFLLGLIAVGSGYVLSQPLTGNAPTFLQRLTQTLPLMKLVQFFLVLGVVVVYGSIFYFHREKESYAEWLPAVVPELVALFALGVLALGSLIWLTFGKFDEFLTRLFVLVFGGCLGSILFFYAILRAIFWRQDIFLGGINAWQGENAYRFWICAYVLIMSLIVMLVSFNLARADIRASVYLRRILYGYDALVQAMLLLGILATANVVIYALMPFSYNWTKSRGAYALSDVTVHLVSNLTKETHFFVLAAQSDPQFYDVRTMLDNCRSLSSKVNVQYVSPDADPATYKILAERFPEIRPDSVSPSAGRGVLVVYGSMPRGNETVPHAFISSQKLFEEQGGRRGGDERAKLVFKGEVEIFNALKFLMQPEQKKRVIYILQGDDQPEVGSTKFMRRLGFNQPFYTLGLGWLVEKLNNENYQVLGLNFGRELSAAKNQDIVFAKETGPDKRKSVPEDCDTLIVAAPGRPLPLETLDAVERYMNRNGKLMVFLDVIANSDYTKLINTGLEPLLKRFGVEVTGDIPLVLRDPNVKVSPYLLLASGAAKSDHVLARQFSERPIVMNDTARTFRVEARAGRFKASPVLQIESRDNRGEVMLEDNPRLLTENLSDYIKGLYQRKLLKSKFPTDPVNVAVAVAETNGDKPRMIVVGDTNFITNFDLAQNSQGQGVSYSFLVSALEWLAERDTLVGLRPQVSPAYALHPNVSTWRMLLVPAWLIGIGVIGLGVGIWLTRRR